MKNLISFCQQKGFIYGPEPEIYGGLAGFYTYGPSGTLLKRRVETVIRQTFQQVHFFEVECPTVLPKIVWEASGHLGGFTDPIIKDKEGNVFRADKLVEEHFHKHKITKHVPTDFEQLLDQGARHQSAIRSRACTIYQRAQSHDAHHHRHGH
jgi:glycyl-tRNA synthetase (class II)